MAASKECLFSICSRPFQQSPIAPDEAEGTCYILGDLPEQTTAAWRGMLRLSAAVYQVELEKVLSD